MRGTHQQLRPMRRPAARHAPARGRFGPCSSHRRKCPCCAVYYCDELCQERDWALHRNACLYDGWESAARRALRPLPRNVKANISDFLYIGRAVSAPLAMNFASQRVAALQSLSHLILRVAVL